MSIPVIQGSQGKMNKDNEPAYVTQGDYLDAKDVRFFTSDGQSTGSHENVDGNKFAFDLGSVAARSKKYRVDNIGGLSGTNTGWDAFGAPDSELFTNQQSYDPHVIEDLANPGNLYMTTGMNVWYYDAGANTWTDLSIATPTWLIDTTPSYSSAKIVMDPVTNFLACVYLKDFGSGLRYVIKEIDPSAGTPTWTSLTGSQGLEAAQGYTYGTYLGYDYGAYFDARVFYDNSGDLYLYAVCVHSDNTQPVTSPFYSNLRIPRVFKYNTGTLVWNDISGLGSSWPVPVEQSWDNIIQYWQDDLRFNIGAPIQSGSVIYFPLCYIRFLSLASTYGSSSIVAAYNTATSSWSIALNDNTSLYTPANTSGRYVLIPPSVASTFNANNLKSWCEPSLAIDLSGDLHISYGTLSSFGGNIFVTRFTSPSVWTNLVHTYFLINYPISTGYGGNSQYGGKVSISIDTTGSVLGGAVDDIYISFQDNAINKRLTVLKYSSGAISFVGLQAVSNFTLGNETSDILIDSTGELIVCFSDYTNASTYSVPIGIPTVYKYVGGASPNDEDFDFFYSNGLQIGSVNNITTVSGFISGLNALFPSSLYSVTTNVIQGTSGYSVEFTVDPLDQNSLPIIGFDYTVTNTGLFPIVLVDEPLSAADSGSLKIIGRYDLLGRLFILSTPNERIIENGPEITVINYSIGANGLDLFIDKSEDLSSYGYVSLLNPLGNTNLSGVHLFTIDTITDPNYNIVTLVGYFPTLIATTLTISGVVVGHGNIGVAIKDENSETWSYTRLIGSNQFAFSTQKQADVIAEQNNRGYSIYFTDNFNPIRSFYYYGEFIQDGAFTINSSVNIYVLGQISDQLQLQKTYGGAYISYTGQGNGKLKNGNYRYSVRFTTSENVTTNWTILSNPFSVFKFQNDTLKIFGGDPEESADRSNIMRVDWTPNPSFEYIEFAYTRFVSDTTSSTGLTSIETKKFGRTRLSQSQSSITYEHTGYELDEIDYEIAELQKIPFFIKKAKNIRSLDNRLVVSNVEVSSAEEDLFDFFSNFTYTLDKKPIENCGSYMPGTGIYERTDPAMASEVAINNIKKITSQGEYFEPSNVFNYMGYMQDETYRFYAVAEYYTGDLSDAYYLFDVKFDTSQTSSDLKRTGSFTDYKLNDGYSGACLIAGSNVYVPYIKINIPPSSLIGGIPAKDVIKRVHIFRADLQEKTILENGLAILSMNDTNTTPGRGYWNQESGNPSYPATGQLYRIYALEPKNDRRYFPFPYIAGTYRFDPMVQCLEVSSYYNPSAPTWPPTKAPDGVARNIIELYSQDSYLTDNKISYIANDKIINYGCYDNYYNYYTLITGNPSVYTSAQFGSFYFNVPSGQAPGGADSEIINLNPSAVSGPVNWLFAGEEIAIGSGTNDYFTKTFTQKYSIPGGAGATYTRTVNHNRSYLLQSSANVSSFGINPTKTGSIDFGCHMISYYRPLTIERQYGDKYLGFGIPTGSYYDLSTDTTQFGTPASQGVMEVFGGDVFTCKSLVKLRYSADTDDFGGQYGVGIEFYSQSRVNPQLRYNPEFEDPLRINYVWPIDYPNPSDPNEYEYWFRVLYPAGVTGRSYAEDIAYNESYSDKNNINVKAIYNPDTYYDSKLPATIFYSDPKLQESPSDSYAYIDPTNRKDLDITLGPINHHEIFNGELITFQDSAVVRQFFNTTAMFADATSQIILGDGGAVLSRKGMTLSTYGTVNKWSVIKGRSQGGNDVLYWFDAISKKIFRIGADGVVPISTRGDIDSFLANNTNFIQLFDKPAYGLGVHGIWDESNNEVVFTFRARKFIQEWVNGTRYSQGDVVFYNGNPVEVYDWHQTGEFYVSNINNNIFVPSESLGQWTHIPHDDANYYNEFTLVYSEDKNGFTSFYTPMPKMYLPYKDRYLSPRPIEPESYVYEHNFGEPCVWYPLDQNDPVSDPTALKSQAYIEGVVNYNPELIKTAEALAIDSDIQPALVEVRSQDHKTFMNSSDFALAETMYRSPVKNDTQGGTVSPDSDTSRVYGRWFAVKFFMDFGVKQKMRSFVTKLRARNRMYNK